MNNINEREQSEINFYRDSEHERPEADSINNLINKMGDCAVFVSLLEKYSSIFNSAKDVLELGGGQGWASCTLKKQFPHLSVTLTDISEYAIMSKHKWERIFNVSVDNAYACRSFEIKEESSPLDIVFCFASAHHFTEMEQTIRNIHHVLKRGGHCLFFHEPATSSLLYKQAYKRVNKNRPVVHEDVLIHSKILKMARNIGFHARVKFNPTLIKRAPMEMMYYFILSKLPVLQKLLPCTANFIFVK